MNRRPSRLSVLGTVPFAACRGGSTSGAHTVVMTLLFLALSAAPLTAQGQSLDTVFRHPTGFFFAHPAAWREQPISDTLMALVPADVRMQQGQPAEIILIGGEDAGGINDPMDPRVLEVSRQFVASALPFMKSKEGATRLQLRGTSAAELIFGGDSPTGLKAKAKMWIRIIEGTAVTLFVAGPVEGFDTRSATAKRVFESFDYEAPQGDTQLVGAWRYTSTYMSGEFSMIEQKILALGSDGRFTEGSQLGGGLQSSGESGNYTGDVGASSGQATRGRWRTADKQITLEWDSGYTEAWEYVISGNDLMFRGGKTKKVWSRIR